ncbi:acyl-CoA thioesterase [Umboniibacter marinipuniceus]|uniref:Acyl-CoA thioester hydrolase n=1 Tax=Umboniibacter marinipuniceus TaxID=569599 RepID=A0A3M0A1R7_9GAMM|nr:thioesterase family protein [Umboniibacter marinipuniceus]RMA78750.1 acyl-CoA thioester hydrolase [Umboniibacter marinipuniceus]
MSVLREAITPSFFETDALGHINNTVVPKWFEKARLPLFRIFTPDLNPADWRLIVLKIEVEYSAQIHYQFPVEIQTWIAKIGNSSFVVNQQVLQHGEICAKGSTVMVHFDYQQQASAPMSEEQKSSLAEFQLAGA